MLDTFPIVKGLIEKYFSDEELKKSAIEDMECDSNDELGFHYLCGFLRKNRSQISSTDKELIDKVGEFLWNDVGEQRMRTKYWKDLVS